MFEIKKKTMIVRDVPESKKKTVFIRELPKKKLFSLLLVLTVCVLLYTIGRQADYRYTAVSEPWHFQTEGEAALGTADAVAADPLFAEDETVAVSAGVSSGSSAFPYITRVPSDDEDWGEVMCPVMQMENTVQFYRYVSSPTLTCDKPVLVGARPVGNTTVMEGRKWVCMAPRYNITPGHCLVYSFGITRNLSFDIDMDRKFLCQVYMFNPTSSGVIHSRPPRMIFTRVGLGNLERPTSPLRPVDRYSNIVQRLGHQNTIIDYLKIDEDGADCEGFHHIITKTPNLLKNVKQIAMQINFQRCGTTLMWKYLQYLECYGFRLWSTEMHRVTSQTYLHPDEPWSFLYEVVWARDRQW